MVLLKSDYSLEPEPRLCDPDVHGRTSFRSRGIASGQYQAAAVAADMLGHAEADGVIAKNQYRSIYKSESFPAAALGYVYNLKPELAAKVTEAMLTFDVKGTPLDVNLGATDQTKMVPLDYKNDFALIRRIDEECAGLRAGK